MNKQIFRPVMQMTWILAMAAAAVALAGCNREMEAPVAGDGFLRAAIETPTRVSFSDEGVFSWQAGDAVAVVTNAGNKTFTLTQGAGEAKATFEGDLTGVTSATAAIFPAAIAKNASTVTLPAEYAWAEGQSNAAMYCAQVDLSKVNSFKHLGGILKISYKEIPAEANALVVKADVPLCGDFAILDGQIVAGMGEGPVKVTFAAGSNPAAFYIPVPTGEYKFSVELQKDGVAIEGTQKATTNPVKIARKSLILMDPIGDETPELIYEIATAEDFLAFVENGKLYAPTDVVKLAADIELPATFLPDTLWCGFDGQDHKVTYNLVIPAESTRSAGLFTYVGEGLTVKNLKVAGSLKSAKVSTGGIAGKVAANVTFENCENEVAVSGETENLTYHLGGIAGDIATGGVFRNCRNKGNVVHTLGASETAKNTQMGGIVAQSNGNILFEDCVNEGNVEFHAMNACRIAGICGYVNDVALAKFMNCVNNGEIISEWKRSSGYAYVGGITGYFGTPSKDCNVLYSGCVNNGKVSSFGNTNIRCRIGGIAAYVGLTDTNAGNVGLALDSGADFALTNCMNNGEISNIGTNSANHIAGLIGFAELAARVIIDGCTQNGKVSQGGAGRAASLIGMRGGTQSTFNNFTITGETLIEVTGAGDGKLLVGDNDAKFVTAMTGKIGPATVSVNGTATQMTAENYRDFLLKSPLGEGGSTEGVVFDGTPAEFSGGSGTEAAPYIIKTAEDLIALAGKVNDETASASYADKYYLQFSDIDMAGKEAVPVGKAKALPFKGHYNGNGKTIANLAVAGMDADNPASGVFGYMEGGEVRNLTVSNRSNTGEQNRVAGIVGESHNTVFENCHITGGELSSAINLIGGIVGDMYGGSIKRCSAYDVKITNTKNYAAALVGFGQDGAVIENCKILAGTVVCGANEVGGIVAKMEGGVIKNCRAEGAAISATAEDVGAIAGWVVGECVISDCVVSGSSVTVGTNYGGGFVGLLEKSTIKDCTLTGKSTVTGNKSGTGGFVGYAKKVDTSVLENCVVDGECVITGVNNTGGIVGWIDAANLKNCLVTGKSQIISSSDGTGGLVGRAICKSGADNWFDGCKVNGGVLVKGKYSVAGLIGYAYPDKNGNMYIVNCGVSDATVHGTLCDTGGDPTKGDCMNGGILGWARFSDAGSKGWIVNCYSYLDAMTLDLDMTHPSVGGIVGYCSLSSAGKLEVLNCVSTFVKETLTMAGAAFNPATPQAGALYGWMPGNAGVKVSGNYYLSGDLAIGSSGEGAVIENNYAVKESYLKEAKSVEALNAFVSGQSTYPLRTWTASAGSLPVIE